MQLDDYKLTMMLQHLFSIHEAGAFRGGAYGPDDIMDNLKVEN